MERGEAEMDADPVFEKQRQLIFNLASSGAFQADLSLAGYANAGGLLSYGNNLTDTGPIGVHAGRILKGDEPGELRVQTTTKFELVINLTTGTWS